VLDQFGEKGRIFIAEVGKLDSDTEARKDIGDGSRKLSRTAVTVPHLEGYRFAALKSEIRASRLPEANESVTSFKYGILSSFLGIASFSPRSTGIYSPEHVTTNFAYSFSVF
jgi:hypothetical protein